ncbi:MAG: hypothetical protein QM493_04855 [Sulfurovum sp.]
MKNIYITDLDHTSLRSDYSILGSISNLNLFHKRYIRYWVVE